MTVQGSASNWTILDFDDNNTTTTTLLLPVEALVLGMKISGAPGRWNGNGSNEQ